MTAAAFITANTVWQSHPLVPEIALALASEITPIWQATEAELAAKALEPPFWAFAWPGSVALARHLLDHPERVQGRRVLDFAAGCGLAGIAAMKAGAYVCTASEIDPLAGEAIALNAARNEVTLEIRTADLVGSASRWDLILCGDICYESGMAARIVPWLRALAQSAEVWLADPGRAYLPRERVTQFASYEVPTTRELEDREYRTTRLLRVERK